MQQFCKIHRVLLCLVFSISRPVMHQKWHNVPVVKVCSYKTDQKKKRKKTFPFLSVLSDTYKKLLPIKPKPLLYPKDSTILTNSRHSSKADQTSCHPILVSYNFNYQLCFSFACARALTYFLSMISEQLFNRKLIINIFDSCMLRISIMQHILSYLF